MTDAVGPTNKAPSQLFLHEQLSLTKVLFDNKRKSLVMNAYDNEINDTSWPNIRGSVLIGFCF